MDSSTPSSFQETERTYMNVVIFVGETGCGKSSLIKAILSSQGLSDVARQVEVAHGMESCTKDPNLYRTGNGSFLVDTCGTNDSSGELDDRDLLSAPMRAICAMGNTQVRAKIIWCCNAVERQTSNLLSQAKFISSIFQSEFVTCDGSDGWDSVMITVKRGRSSNDRRAPVFAAEKAGCQSDDIVDRVVMADVLDWGDADDDDRRQQVDTAMNLSSEQRKILRLCLESDFVPLVKEMVEAMPFFQLRFVNERCVKCDMTGDSRFFVNQCHAEPTRVHESIEMIHPASDRGHASQKKKHVVHRVHSSETRPSHGERTWVHSEKRRFVHGQLMRVHGGVRQRNYNRRTVKKTKKSWGHAGHREYRNTTGAVFAGIFTLGVRHSSGKANYYMSCCGGGERKSGCDWIYESDDEEEQFEIAPTCTKCDRDWGDSGCVDKCTTCNKFTTTKGCQEMCDECVQRPNIGGCLQQCKSCLELVTEDPCLVLCAKCKRVPESDGCRDECGICHSGDPLNDEGCLMVCCDGLVSQEGCRDFCSGCGLDLTENPRGCVYECCGLEADSGGCKDACRVCEKFLPCEAGGLNCGGDHECTDELNDSEDRKEDA